MERNLPSPPGHLRDSTRMIAADLSNPGPLVHARGREWVVLPDSTDDLLMVRPVGGLDEEVTGILPAVESVASTEFQLPPLMMALKLDPVRLLIADDVGIGKTIEAAVIARELLDRGEIRRLVVLCPPHLAEQWQRELAEKFHIEAELVLSSTIQRLERDLPLGVSVFDRYR